MAKQQRKRITIKEDDPHKDFKLEIIDLIKNEINYTVNRMLIKVLIWVFLIMIPTVGGWSVVQYRQASTITEIESNRVYNDSIIAKVGQATYESNIDKQRLDAACKDVQTLKDFKADKLYVDEMLNKMDKEFDKNRQFEREILQRQDLMLKHLLDLKRGM